MPSDLRPKQGRNRSKNRTFLHGARWKIAVADSRYRRENPALRVYPGASGSRQGVNMAAGPQFSFCSAVRQCLQNMWAQRHLGLFLLLLWTLVILFYLVSTDSVSPKEKLQRHSKAPEHGSNWEFLLNFFFPTTCIIRENQEVVACNKHPYLSKTECLRFKCCFSSSGTKMRCYAPLRDKPKQMFRVFGFAVTSMIILGFLPMCCCSLCQRSRWFNPLRRKMNRVLKVLKKQKTKLKRKPRARKAPKEERGDRKEQESRALLSN
ncbi:FMR1 neighbor protein isoform X1 [Peromyscus eremicus]|uniref:FMR1 neighbor protein isoform X1 n=1 Tax=Peromyscus eremicus TaxID=42410 RepID=UPI0027DD9C45|nr:FMR1 neighbor protein isoform X1 [Peromyscus eremicus]